MPISDINTVITRALNGSPLLVVTLKIFRKGSTPSHPMACNNLGAPENKTTLFKFLLHNKPIY